MRPVGRVRVASLAAATVAFALVSCGSVDGEPVATHVEVAPEPRDAGSAVPPPEADRPLPPPREVRAPRLSEVQRLPAYLAPDGDVGRSAARFLASSQSEFDPTGDEQPGALDHHGSGEIDPKATVFTHLARLREAMPRWTLELFDVDGDLVADHLQVTAPDTGRRWCVDFPEEPAGTYRHTAGACPLRSDLAPVRIPGPGRRDGPG